MAQVYSVNVVGYVNVTVPVNGWAILANPLNNGANAFSDVLKLPTDGSADFVTVYRYDGVGQKFLSSATFFGGTWDAADPKALAALAPGEGFFIQNPGTAALTITFVGEVPQGSLSVNVPNGWALMGSQVPQAARVGTMGFPADDFDTIYLFDSATQAYAPSYTFFLGAWDAANDHDANGPTIAVGNGFWTQKSNGAKAWSRSFTVN
jgi:hypothetical protein